MPEPKTDEVDDELETDAERDTDVEEEAAFAEPASGPRSNPSDASVDVRAKLTALRVEVESFLDELESGAEP